MYIDYNKKICIIAYLIRYKKNIISKYILIYKINKLINYYNDNINYDDIFVNGYKLDKEQTMAVYTNELITLVAAGAGSGKTSLIIGKINYLIERCNIGKDEILCLSFTNEAVNNLRNRLKYNVDVMTFHKLSIYILKGKYRINNNYLSYVVDEYFEGIVIHNKKILKILVNLIDKTDTKKYSYYLNNGYFDYLKYTIVKFIELFIVSGKEIKDFLKIKKYKKLMTIIIDIYYLYINELKSKYEIDLNGLIKLATYNVNKANLKYKYIIVDEFQDISLVRMNLLFKLFSDLKAKLLLVGDDYQSIYGFSGSNLESYLKIYKKEYTKVIYLKNNYRCSKEIVNISNKFITKNKKQIKKQIFSSKNVDKPIIIVDGKLDKLIHYLKDNEILILSRNNKDIYNYISKAELNKYQNVKYMTVHSAKGLESDVVIIINMEDNITGFPSQIKNPEFIDYVFPKEKYIYAEERRLFYVALTRTKSRVYILKPKKYSIFLQEIIKDNKKSITYLHLE